MAISLRSKFLLTLLLLLASESVFRCYGYTCSTTDDDGEEPDSDTAEEFIRSHTDEAPTKQEKTLWPDGIVKFNLSSTLRPQDIKQVYLAMEEYHKKTCIRFEPWKSGDPNWISIELDSTIECGLARVCMKGGDQFVKVNPNCSEKVTFIHELGHALCLRHEHQRIDRDAYIHYNGCNKTNTQTKKQRINHPQKLYDYASQMHYECGSCRLGGWSTEMPENVSKCGPQATTGLSILDADYINALYNCQGCFRHRWISTSARDNTTFRLGYWKHPSFSNKYFFGNRYYPCRAKFNGKIVVGEYYEPYKQCGFVNDKKYAVMKHDFEVLSVPGGSRDVTSYYFLVKVKNGSLDSIIADVVTAGHSMRDSRSQFGDEYIAYDLSRDDYIGNVAKQNKEKYYKAYFMSEHDGVLDYRILACKNRKVNDFGIYAGHDIYKNWKLRHMKTLDRPLTAGMNIKITGMVLPNAETFFIDLVEDISGGPIVLHFNARFDWRGSKEKIFCNSVRNNTWGDEVCVDEGGVFSFEKNKIFILEILVLPRIFQFKVAPNIHVSKETFHIGYFRNTREGMHLHSKSIQNVRFLRVHGDVSIINVEIDTGNIILNNATLTNPTGMNTVDSTVHPNTIKIAGNNDTPRNPMNNGVFIYNMETTTKSTAMIKGIGYGIIITLAIIGLIALVILVKVIFQVIDNKFNNGFQTVPVIYTPEQI